jgi:type IV pilus assembly protein PilC
MPVYDYEVADPRGALSRGRAEADTTAALVARFREQGRLVLAVRPVGRRMPGDGGGAGAMLDGARRAVRRLSSGVGLGTLLLFTGQLAAMLAGGLHLARILASLAAESTSRRLKAVLADVGGAIAGGSSFADALGRHPHVFDRLYVAVVRAGELSGSLPLVLDSLTIYLEKTAQLRRKILGAIAYPVVILAVAGIVVFVMVVKLVPVFESVYARSNATLPAATRLLITISAAVRGYALVGVAALLALVALGHLLAQTDAGRRLRDRATLRLPLFGSLIRKAIMARTCRTLALLLQAGIPLVEAMETVARVSNNKVIEDALLLSIQRMRDGRTMAEALRQSRQFPSMVVQLVATGEESGTLPAMLGRGAGYYEQQVDTAVATLSTLVEPVLIVIMGAVAGSVIFALYLPIFTLGQAVKGLR